MIQFPNVSPEEWIGIAQAIFAGGLIIATLVLVKATNNLWRIEIFPNFLRTGENIQEREFRVMFENRGRGAAKNVVAKAKGKDGSQKEIELRDISHVDVPVGGRIDFVVHDVAADEVVSISLEYSDIKNGKCPTQTFSYDIKNTPRSPMP